MPISHIAFLTPGNYPLEAPLQGLEAALRLFEFAERLGFNSAWVRSRHLERGISSAPTFLAAASQRTLRIELGSAVIQMGYENPFRLAEDLATVDVLARGRLQVGLSAGAPSYSPVLGDRFLDGDPKDYDFSHSRVLRLRDNLRRETFGGEEAKVLSPAGDQRPRIQPVAEGLVDRLWYGGGSLRSAEWAGRNGFNFMIGNLNQGEKTNSFLEAQLSHLDLFLTAWRAPRRPRVGLGRVIVPFDSAGQRTREKYRTFAAGRHERTLAPQGERRTLFAPDLVGSSDEILEGLRRDPVLSQVSELRLELPYDLAEEQYRQILSDFVNFIAPELGWKDNRDFDDGTG